MQVTRSPVGRIAHQIGPRRSHIVIVPRYSPRSIPSLIVVALFGFGAASAALIASNRCVAPATGGTAGGIDCDDGAASSGLGRAPRSFPTTMAMLQHAMGRTTCIFSQYQKAPECFGTQNRN